MGRGDLTNAEWDRLESFLPASGARGGRWSDHRRVINGVLYRVRTGVQRRDLPESSGPWETVYKRHRRWSADGTWTMLLSRVQAAEDAVGGIDWDVSVDPTSVRAHQHAAGARNAPPAEVPQRGPVKGRTRSIRCYGNWPSGWRRWSERRMSGTFPRWVHHQDPPRCRGTMPTPWPRPDARTLR
jgi:transposase